MKLSTDAQRKIILEALDKSDGNREVAAKSLGVSIRTFYRYLKDLDLFGELDKRGWTSRNGPPRGAPKGSSVVRMRILEHVRKVRGNIDYGKLATEIYKQDGREERQRIYSALEDLKSQGVVAVRNSIWTIVGDKVIL